MNLLDYVKCREYVLKVSEKAIWRELTEERVLMASEVAEEMCRGVSFTQASKDVAERYGVSYRRLQNFAIEMGLVGKGVGGKEYKPYGKLCMYKIYNSSSMTKKGSPIPDIDIVLFIPTPLHYDCTDALDEAEKIAFDKAEEILSVDLMELVTWNEGCEEFKGVDPYGEDYMRWCNKVLRVPLTEEVIGDLVLYKDKATYGYSIDTNDTGCDVWK